MYEVEFKRTGAECYTLFLSYPFVLLELHSFQ